MYKWYRYKGKCLYNKQCEFAIGSPGLGKVLDVLGYVILRTVRTRVRHGIGSQMSCHCM